MSIETDIKTVLDGYANLTAIVQTRTYVVSLPQNPTYPNVVLSYRREIENHLTGESDLEHVICQMDIRASTYSVTRSIAIQLKAAMASSTTFQSVCLSDDDVPYEDIVEYFRTVVRFSVWQ